MSPRRESAPESSGPSNAWMATFSDLLMLMLTFFVLLLTMSSLDSKKVRELARSGVHPEPSSNQNSAIPLEATVEPPLIASVTAALGRISEGEEERAAVRRLMDALLKLTGIGGFSWVDIRPWGVVVTVEGEGAFEKDRAVLTAETRRFIKSLGEIVGANDANLIIETYVHAEGDWDAQDRAWELALLRMDSAANAAEKSGIDGQRIRVLAKGRKAGSKEKAFVQGSENIRFNLVVGEQWAEWE